MNLKNSSLHLKQGSNILKIYLDKLFNLVEVQVKLLLLLLLKNRNEILNLILICTAWIIDRQQQPQDTATANMPRLPFT